LLASLLFPSIWCISVSLAAIILLPALASSALGFPSFLIFRHGFLSPQLIPDLPTVAKYEQNAA
jgi:hypothetical protein